MNDLAGVNFEVYWGHTHEAVHCTIIQNALLFRVTLAINTRENTAKKRIMNE